MALQVYSDMKKVGDFFKKAIRETATKVRAGVEELKGPSGSWKSSDSGAAAFPVSATLIEPSEEPDVAAVDKPQGIAAVFPIN
jgi:hypothetical protein